METVRVVQRACWLPKDGHTAAEYEDAFALPVHERPLLSAAVADGATESAFAGLWARQLTEAFVAAHPMTPAALHSHVQHCRRAWDEAVAARAATLPWYAATKAQQGAFATLLGLVLQDDGSWHALSVGDCCLFHLRAGAEQLRWPLEAPEQFGNRPDLLPSRLPEDEPPVQRQEGSWQAGDTFLLATDAVAAWLMRDLPAAVQAVDQEGFAVLVAAARKNGTMRNDDATLVILDVQASTRPH